MRKFKSFLSVLCAAAGVLTVVGGCGKGDNAGKQEEPYPHNFYCGYLLTFWDPQDENYQSPTSNDFTSDDAITRYVTRNYYGDSNKSYLGVWGGLFVNNSHNAIQISGNPLDLNKSGSITMCEELYYTFELFDKYANLQLIYYDVTKEELCAEDYTSYNLSSQGTAFASDEMQAVIFNSDGEWETLNYIFDLSVYFYHTDLLESVTVSEYDEDNVLINTITRSSTWLKDLNNYTYNYQAGQNCQYIVISKQYRDRDGKTYTERTLYNNDKLSQSDVFYVPYGNGLTMPMEIKLTFEN